MTFEARHSSQTILIDDVKRLDTNPDADYIKVPCKFNGWKYVKEQNHGSGVKPRDLNRRHSIKGNMMLDSLLNETINTGKPQKIAAKPTANSPTNLYNTRYSMSFNSESGTFHKRMAS